MMEWTMEKPHGFEQFLKRRKARLIEDGMTADTFWSVSFGLKQQTNYISGGSSISVHCQTILGLLFSKIISRKMESTWLEGLPPNCRSKSKRSCLGNWLKWKHWKRRQYIMGCGDKTNFSFSKLWLPLELVDKMRNFYQGRWLPHICIMIVRIGSMQRRMVDPILLFGGKFSAGHGTLSIPGTHSVVS